MSSFLIDLWESIFTPGPTPTILRATNLSFGALQLVLLALLFATGSIHFVVLSVLCAGLWWAINWFARELAAAAQLQGQEEQVQVRERKPNQGGAGEGAAAAAGGAGGEDSSETEVETTTTTTSTTGPNTDVRYRGLSRGVRVGDEPEEGKDASVSQSSASTEDEWEKVSGAGERDKRKGE
ncbi:hypothetical protein E4U41_003985 [Claviceps citrina]|nr:hypothetical protein E4U41_003985 [Claviceps citrina]